MVQDALHDFRTYPLFLIRLVHDDIPDCGPIHKIRQHPPEANQLIAIPGA